MIKGRSRSVSAPAGYEKENLLKSFGVSRQYLIYNKYVKKLCFDLEEIVKSYHEWKSFPFTGIVPQIPGCGLWAFGGRGRNLS